MNVRITRQQQCCFGDQCAFICQLLPAALLVHNPYAMLCYAMLCYAMLCYAMLCYAMLCYAVM